MPQHFSHNITAFVPAQYQPSLLMLSLALTKDLCSELSMYWNPLDIPHRLQLAVNFSIISFLRRALFFRPQVNALLKHE